jgi:hypothetical protein
MMVNFVTKDAITLLCHPSLGDDKLSMSQLGVRIAKELGSQKGPIPLGSLIVLFHVATGIESSADILRPRDEAEARNYRVYSELVGLGDQKFVNAAISGAFKPPGFIHPFERHYSLPGYLDQPVLSMFFSAADGWAKARVCHEHGKGFLSFIYMFFLLIHPFIDRNGRVARALLDYYDEKLQLNLSPVWREKGFTERPVHKDAFRLFFEFEAKLPPRESLSDPYPISAELRPHLGRMADYMLDWAARVAAMAGGKAAGDPFEIQESRKEGDPAIRRSHISRFKQAWKT